MIQELRLYTIIPGREEVEPIRFGSELPKLLERHGINCVGAWHGTAGASGPTFAYVMIYESLADREAGWAAFYADPDWARHRAETQGEEECVERFDIHFLRDNPAWLPHLDLGPTRHVGGIHDLCLAEAAIGQTRATNTLLADAWLPAIERAGAELMMVSDFITGPRLPKVAVMMAWPSADARHQGWRTLRNDPELHAARKADRKALGRPSVGTMDVWALDPLAELPTRTRLGRPVTSSRP